MTAFNGSDLFCLEYASYCKIYQVKVIYSFFILYTRTMIDCYCLVCDCNCNSKLKQQPIFVQLISLLVQSTVAIVILHNCKLDQNFCTMHFNICTVRFRTFFNKQGNERLSLLSFLQPYFYNFHDFSWQVNGCNAMLDMLVSHLTAHLIQSEQSFIYNSSFN